MPFSIRSITRDGLPTVQQRNHGLLKVPQSLHRNSATTTCPRPRGLFAANFFSIGFQVFVSAVPQATAKNIAEGIRVVSDILYVVFPDLSQRLPCSSFLFIDDRSKVLSLRGRLPKQ